MDPESHICVLQFMRVKYGGIMPSLERVEYRSLSSTFHVQAFQKDIVF
jgi:hypothetical protein